MFRCAPDNEDGADVSLERQQQGELDQEAGGAEGSDGFRDSDDDLEPDAASEGKGTSEDEEDEDEDEQDNDRSDEDDYKGSKGIDVFLVM